MKLKLSLKNKEASLEADVERLVEKGMDQKVSSPPKKTRYQIKQEEKRKNKELEFKQKIYAFVLGGVALAMLFAFLFVMMILENQGII